MERHGFRQHALDAVHRTRWMPEWGEERIGNMIASRPDWCISRQRVWGVPIIVFYCDACREPLTDRKILDGIVDLFRRAHRGRLVRAHRRRTAARRREACPKCGGAEFSKETDILDVWFDSGSSHLAVLNERFGLQWPADLYLEGGDQYRGWFHSSLLVGTGLKGGSPYRACALNGWVLDGEGRAMHKSLGNAIEPEEVIKRNGAEILRLWSASVNFNEDVRMSDTSSRTRLVDAYRKMRNTFRYMLGNLSDFDAGARTPCPRLGTGTKSISGSWGAAAGPHRRAAAAWYESFEFHRVYHAVYAFATVDLSAVYFDVLKDRLYTSAAKSPGAARRRRPRCTRLLNALVRLLAPIMSFTAEEVWTHMRGAGKRTYGVLFPSPERTDSRASPMWRGNGPAQLGPSHGQ